MFSENESCISFFEVCGACFLFSRTKQSVATNKEDISLKNARCFVKFIDSDGCN